MGTGENESAADHGVYAGFDTPVDVTRVETVSPFDADPGYLKPVGKHFGGVPIILTSKTCLINNNNIKYAI